MVNDSFGFSIHYWWLILCPSPWTLLSLRPHHLLSDFFRPEKCSLFHFPLFGHLEVHIFEAECGDHPLLDDVFLGVSAPAASRVHGHLPLEDWGAVGVCPVAVGRQGGTSPSCRGICIEVQWHCLVQVGCLASAGGCSLLLSCQSPSHL